MFLANVGSMFNPYDADIFMYKPQRPKCFFYLPPDEVGAGGYGVASDVRRCISFPEQILETQGRISLILHTHIP